ncbi:hypothetical protein ACE6H2_022803 [Prunus campanulata]
MVANFDSYNKSITAHEKTMRISPSDFERIMGYKDSGCGVKTSGWCKRSGRSTTSEVYVGKVWGEKTSKKVIMCVKSKGGFESNKICVRRRDVISRKDYEVSREGGCVDEIAALQREVGVLNERVDKLERKKKRKRKRKRKSEILEACNV